MMNAWKNVRSKKAGRDLDINGLRIVKNQQT